MSGKLNARFPCPKLKDDQFAPLAVMAYSQVDKGAVLAAADGGGDPATALGRRFTDHLNSPNEVLPFDLFVRQPLADATPYYSASGQASAIIDLIARGDDVVNELYQCVFELKRSRTFLSRAFPSPLR